MQRQGKGSWEKRKARRRSQYKRLTRFNQSQVYQVAVAFQTTSFACRLAQMVHGVSMCVGSVSSSRDQLFPPIFFLSSLRIATAKGEIGYEADYTEQLHVLRIKRSKQPRSCIPRHYVWTTSLQGRDYRLIKAMERKKCRRCRAVFC